MNKVKLSSSLNRLSLSTNMHDIIWKIGEERVRKERRLTGAIYDEGLNLQNNTQYIEIVEGLSEGEEIVSSTTTTTTTTNNNQHGPGAMGILGGGPPPR